MILRKLLVISLITLSSTSWAVNFREAVKHIDADTRELGILSNHGGACLTDTVVLKDYVIMPKNIDDLCTLYSLKKGSRTPTFLIAGYAQASYYSKIDESHLVFRKDDINYITDGQTVKEWNFLDTPSKIYGQNQQLTIKTNNIKRIDSSTYLITDSSFYIYKENESRVLNIRDFYSGENFLSIEDYFIIGRNIVFKYIYGIAAFNIDEEKIINLYTRENHETITLWPENPTKDVYTENLYFVTESSSKSLYKLDLENYIASEIFKEKSLTPSIERDYFHIGGNIVETPSEIIFVSLRNPDENDFYQSFLHYSIFSFNKNTNEITRVSKDTIDSVKEVKLIQIKDKILIYREYLVNLYEGRSEVLLLQDGVTTNLTKSDKVNIEFPVNARWLKDDSTLYFIFKDSIFYFDADSSDYGYIPAEFENAKSIEQFVFNKELFKLGINLNSSLDPKYTLGVFNFKTKEFEVGQYSKYITKNNSSIRQYTHQFEDNAILLSYTGKDESNRGIFNITHIKNTGEAKKYSNRRT